MNPSKRLRHRDPRAEQALRPQIGARPPRPGDPARPHPRHRRANGAGKSTLFRILMGFTPPTSGEARASSAATARRSRQDRARIGFVNEEHTLASWMRVSQVTTMQKHQYPRWNQQAFDNVIGHYHVPPEQKVGQLSRRARRLQPGAGAGAGPGAAGAGRADAGPRCRRQARVPGVAAVQQRRRRLHGGVLLAPDGRDRARRRQPHHPERGPAQHMSAPEEFTARVSHWSPTCRSRDRRRIPCRPA